MRNSVRRSFLMRAYPIMKHHNPHTPIMIREASGVEPRVYARYEFGREQVADLKGKSSRRAAHARMRH
jgi:NADH dehydrogenase (ubiquinone) 1 alpha subcomplex subunit 2